MKRLALLLVALLAWAVVPSGGGGAAQAESVPRLHREGRFLVDQYGRVVIVHGLNIVWKRPPYAPPDTAAGFTARDAAFFQHYGFNGARLGVLWAGVTPRQPGVVDPAYFQRLDRVTGLLAKHHVWTLLDMHQDMWNEEYGGEGVPAWAAKRPLPFSLAPYQKVPFPMGYWTPEVSQVFDDFWADKSHLLTDWAGTWRLIAQHYRDQPWSMGYDVLNEAWAGQEWSTCLATGCPTTYTTELQPAMTTALRAIRSADPRGMVWWEPQQFAGGQKLDSYYTRVPGEQDLGFSFHNYCPDVFLASQGVPGSNTDNCNSFSQDRNSMGIDQAKRMGAAALMTEWGATDDVKAVGIDAATADENRMGWTYWAYKHWDDPTTADASQGLFTDDADLSTVKQAKLRQLVRTYPQATAGTPLAYHYDTATGRFTFRYLPNRSISAPTQVFVSPLTSPHGYAVTATGARWTSSGSTVLLTAISDRPVSVVVTPRP
ncbi:MAG: cellulase family glycosylhydrolase [Marmoricola sp.]|nr:cellulase family glycosylhydrolase [Marmoricola sp.]